LTTVSVLVCRFPSWRRKVSNQPFWRSNHFGLKGPTHMHCVYVPFISFFYSIYWSLHTRWDQIEFWRIVRICICSLIFFLHLSSLIKFISLCCLNFYTYFDEWCLRRTAYNKAFEMVLNLNFGDGCGCSSLEVDVPIDFTVRLA
jgi:hypothetical protein